MLARLSPFTSEGEGFLMVAMLNVGAWLVFPLLILPLVAEELPSGVDTITPVPPPEIALGGLGLGAETLPDQLKIDNFGGGTQTFTQDSVVFAGPGIKVTGDNGMEIFADRVVVDRKAASATLEGNVSVYQGNVLQRGQRAVYFYERKFLDASGLRISLDPILLEAGKFTVEEQNGKKVYVGEDAGITTDDQETPDYWVRAKKTTIVPGEKIVFNDLRLYAGEVPVFWLPYFSHPLDAQLGYHFLPGSRSNWGPFLLNTYGTMLGGKINPMTGENEDAWLLARWRLDLRASRGVGVGVDLVDRKADNSDEISGLSLYYLYDTDPQNTRSGIPRGPLDADRYRIELKQRFKLDLPDEADWRIDSNLTLLSDQHFLEDFDIARYRMDPAPDNTLGIYRRDDASLLSLYGRFRINDFYRSDTRSPELSFDQAAAPLFGLPLIHEGNTSLGIIGENAADPTRKMILEPLVSLTPGAAAEGFLNQLTGFDRQLAEQMIALPLGDPRRDAIRTQLIDSSYARFNSFQQVSLPLTFGDFLSLVPNAGVGYTSYAAVDGPIDNLDRLTLHAGTEASVKFSKDFGNYRNARWGLDGLRHILQPYSQWSVLTTNDFEPGDPQVDRLTPTTRPRPLDPSRFTAVDELQSWNIVRLGARNRLITKRDSQSYEWLYLDTYIDAFLQDPEAQRNYSNLYNDLRWQPLPWMGLDVQTQFPIASGGSGFNEFTGRLRFMPTQNFQFSLGYRSLNNHPVFIDSNRIDFSTYLNISEGWGMSSRHTLELDDGTLEVQQYSLHRDLGNWVAGLGFTHRDNRVATEYGVFLSLTLKNLPAVSLPFQLETQ